MRHIRMTGLCLVAVFLVGAVVAASASAALPEWGGCEAAARTEVLQGNHLVSVTWKGKYENAQCTNPNQPEGKALTGQAIKEKGQYEWYTGKNFGIVHNLEKGLTTGYGYTPLKLSIGDTTFETIAGKAITCPGGHGEMTTGGSKLVDEEVQTTENPTEVEDVQLVFEGCKEAGGAKAECSSQFYLDGPESIDNEETYTSEKGFKGKLGFVAGKGGGNPTVGLYLTGFEKEEKLFVVECEGSLATVWIGGTNKKGKNSVISVISPVDELVGEGQPTNAFTEAFSESGGVQAQKKFEGGPELALQEEVGSRGFEPAAWSSTFTDLPQEGAPPIEIKAIP